MERVEVYDEDGDLQPLSAPGSGAVIVAAQNTSIKISFDRFLFPPSAIRQAICIGNRTNDTAASTCTDLTDATLGASYDPVQRQITYRVNPDTFSLGTIRPGSYLLTIYQGSVTDRFAPGVVAFDGQPLGAAVSFAFDVGHTTLDPDPDPSPDRLNSAFCGKGAGDDLAPRSVLTNNCAFSGCHVSGADAPMGLQLASSVLGGQAIALRRTAIGRVAHETMEGERADDGTGEPGRFGRAMPIIDATGNGDGIGSAGNSYILYKLLTSTDTNGAPFAPADEVQRLREEVVVGAPMPLPFNETQPRQPLTFEQIAALSRWIQAGAATDPCP